MSARVQCDDWLFVHSVEIRHLDNLVRVCFSSPTARLTIDVRPRYNDQFAPTETLEEIAARYPRSFSVRLGLLETRS